jgi:hypothetical protein
MRHLTAATVVAALLAPTASTQVSAYTWTFKGNPGGSGTVLPDSLLVVGPDDGSVAQFGNVSWLEASTPVPLHVTVTCEYTNNDDGENDAPVWVLDGVYHKPDTGGFWGTGEFDFSFDVLPGHSFGFGIWTSDAILGAGIGHFVDFVATPYTWYDWGGGIDPQPWFSTSTETEFPDSLCGLGDVDGDGVRELVVSSHADELHVYSGATGQTLYQVPVPSLGNPVDDAGDVNADGVPDFVVGLPFASSFDGRVQVRSGSDGAAIFSHALGAPGLNEFGTGVAGLGDVDGDGYDDVAGGAPFAQGDKGEVQVLGGPDGHVIHDLVGPGSPPQFGRHVAALGDVDHDGVIDFGVTQQGAGFAKVLVYSGATAGLITVASEAQIETGTNTSCIASAGDFDGDGTPDIAWWLNPHTLGNGEVTIHSGATGAELKSWPQSLSASEDLATVSAGDVNGDGPADIAFSAMVPGPDGGHLVIRIYSGAAGHPLLEQLETGGTTVFGAVVKAFGDVDLDGAADLAVGPWDATGQTRVLHALDGHGPPNLHGVGTLVGGTPMAIVIKDGKANAPYTMVVGAAYLGAPCKGGTLVPQPLLLLPGLLDSYGRGTISATWPMGLAGPFNFWAQGWIVDSDAPHGLTATNGISGSVP